MKAGRPGRSSTRWACSGTSLEKSAARLDAIGRNELAAANKTLAARKLEPVNLLTEEEWKKKGQ